MKKTLIAMTVACVGALAALAEDAPVPYEDLKLGTNLWFSLTADGSTLVPFGGQVTQGPFTANEGRISFDSPDTPTAFQAADDCTQQLATVTFAVKASTVPYGRLKPDAVSGKVAVSLYESAKNGTTNFVAWAGGDRLNLDCDAVPYEGDDYTLIVRFDTREAGKVSFAWADDVAEHLMTTGSAKIAWFDCTVNFEAKRNVGFLGKGSLTKLVGAQLNIVAEIVPTDDGAIAVKEEDKSAIDAAAAAKGKTVPEYLQSEVNGTVTGASRAAAGVTVAQAYALGLVKRNGDAAVVAVNEGALEVKADAAQVTDEGISVRFAEGITPHPETVQSIEYQLSGSATGDTYQPIQGATFTEASAIRIPTTALGTYHFFKVSAKVNFIPRPVGQVTDVN